MNGAEKLSVRDGQPGAVITVKAVPGASRDKVAGVLGDALKITTAAAAEKGKANAAVARTLAKALGVSPRDVELIAGATSPRKEFQIAGTTAQQLLTKLRRL